MNGDCSILNYSFGQIIEKKLNNKIFTRIEKRIPNPIAFRVEGLPNLAPTIPAPPDKIANATLVSADSLQLVRKDVESNIPKTAKAAKTITTMNGPFFILSLLFLL